MSTRVLGEIKAKGESAASAITILYIAGQGRSGSTVLSAMLGTHSGFWPVGEIRGVWQAIRTDELCGCGRRFSECAFWHEVGDRAFGGWENVDSEHMIRVDAGFARHRSVHRLLLPPLRTRAADSLRAYAEVLTGLYAAVKQVSGCSVIVDSTKDPPYAFILREVESVDLRVVHLVRDSRGVAYSWAKEDVERPEYANHPSLRSTFMKSQATWRSALEWDAKNALSHWLGVTGVPRLLIRYEELASAPSAVMGRVLAFSRMEGSDAPNQGGEAESRHEYESLPHHTLGGNRVRFDRGLVRLRPDLEWRKAMDRRQRLLVTALTFPFLYRYGYVRIDR